MVPLGLKKLKILCSWLHSISVSLSCVLSGETSVDNVLDVHLGTILQHVRLNYLLEREEGGWDANLNWEDILSLGEQQRLGMVSDS